MNRRVLIAAGALAAASGSVFAQIGGTVYVDFAGFANTPQGSVTALSTAGFTGLVPADLPNFKTQIVSRIQAAYAGFSINITDILPAGNFTRLVIGNTGTQSAGALGIANEIDFRNHRDNNVVSVLASEHTTPPFFPSTLGFYSQMMANTAAHELGHVLGLMHSDPVSTFVNANAASVQASEIMRARVAFNSNNEYAPVRFGDYSRQKLTIATQGVNVQPENAAANFVFPFGADPARAGDAGGTVATARILNFDTNNNDVVLGTLANDTDAYKFTVPANTFVTAEVFSKALVAGTSPTSVGRITDAIDAVLDIVDNTDTVIQTVQFTSSLDIDNVAGGDAGSDQLIYRFALPAAGTYAVRVRGGADATGDYELYVNIPAPGSAMVLAVGGFLAARRRR